MFTIITICIGLFLSHANAQLECRQVSFESIQINPNDVRVSWTVDNNCASTYTISHYIDDYFIGQRVVPHPASATWLDRIDCSRNNVTIHTQTRPDRGEIDPVSTIFYLECDKCHPITVEFEELEETIRVSWTTNPCAVQYRVTHLIDDELATIVMVPNPVSSIQITRRSCSKNKIIVSTIALDADKKFEDVSVDVTIGLPGDGAVQNLRYNSDTGYIEWEAPGGSQLCELEFIIEFSNELQDFETRTTNTFYDLPAYPCTTNYVNVTTLIGRFEEYAGAKQLVHIAPINRTLPEHVKTLPSETGADAQWYILPEGPTACVVTDFYITISEENAVSPADQTSLRDYYNQIGELEYSFTGLQEGSVYDYKLCFEFEQDPDVPLCTKTITFPTQTLEEPYITVNTDTTSNIGVSWTTNEDADRFVTAHTISIEPLRTHHFTPSYCDINWNFTKDVKSDVKPDVTTVIFDNAYPSFVYNVMVIRHFGDLGVDRVALEEDVVTIETIPGYLNLETSYIYEPSTVYSVTLKAKWGIPCDVNGAVRSFAYTLRGELQSDDETVICKDMVFESGVIDLSVKDFDDSEIDPIYEIEIPDLLPFFKYSLSVSTNLEKYSSTTEIQLDEVPPAYTPNS